MVRKKEQQRMKGLLSEAITVLCKASLSYRSEFSIEGLIGITLDNEEIFLVNINELVQKPGLKPPPEVHDRPRTPPKRRLSSQSQSPHHSNTPSPSHRTEDPQRPPVSSRRKQHEPVPTTKRIKTDSDPIIIKEEEDSDDADTSQQSPAPSGSPALASPQHDDDMATAQDSSMDTITNIVDTVTGSKSDTPYEIQQVPGFEESTDGKMMEDYGSHLSFSTESSLPGCSGWDGLSQGAGGSQGSAGNQSQEVITKIKQEVDADNSSTSSWQGGAAGSSQEVAKNCVSPENVWPPNFFKEAFGESSAGEESVGKLSVREAPETSTAGTGLSAERKSQTEEEKRDMTDFKVKDVDVSQLVKRVLEKKLSVDSRPQSPATPEASQRDLKSKETSEGKSPHAVPAMDVDPPPEELLQPHTAISKGMDMKAATNQQLILAQMQAQLMMSQAAALNTFGGAGLMSPFASGLAAPYMAGLYGAQAANKPPTAPAMTNPIPSTPPGTYSSNGSNYTVLDGRYTCNVCGKSYTKRANLSSHMLLHKGRVYTCTMCGKTFNHPNYLSQHMKYVHAARRDFRCKLCGKEFAKNQNLQVHLARHVTGRQGDPSLLDLSADEMNAIYGETTNTNNFSQNTSLNTESVTNENTENGDV